MKRYLLISVLLGIFFAPLFVSAAPASGYKFVTNERLSTWRGMRDSNHVLWQVAVSTCNLTGTAQQRYGDRGVWCAVIAAVNNDATAATKAISALRGINQSAGANEIREDFIARVLQLDLVHPWLTSADLAVISPKLDTWAAKSPNLIDGDSDAIVGEGCGAILWDIYNGRNPNRPNIYNNLSRYIGFAQGGQWIESSQYNSGTTKLLAMCNLANQGAKGQDIVPGVSAWFAEAGTVAALEITPDLQNWIQWGDDQYPRDFLGRLYNRAAFLGIVPNGYARATLDSLMSRNWPWFASQLMEHAFLLWRTDVSPTPIPNPMIHVADGVGQVFYRNGNTLMWAMGRNNVPVDHLGFATTNDIQVYQNGGWLLTHPIAYYGLMSGELIPNSPVYAGLNYFVDGMQKLWTSKGTDWVAIANKTSGRYFTYGIWPTPAPFLRYGGRVTLLATVNGNPVVIVRDDVDMDNPINTGSGISAFVQNSNYQHQTRVNEFEGKFWSIWHMPEKPSINGSTISWTAPNGTPVSLQNFSDQPIRFVTKDETSVFGSDVTSAEKKWQTRVNTDASSLFQVFTVRGETVSRSGDTITVGNKSWTITKNGVTPSSGGVVVTPPTPPTQPPQQPPTTPPSTKFTSGGYVETTSVLNVRSSPSTSASVVGTQQTGSKGTVVGTSVYADGYHWWNINYQNGADGWSAEDFLVVQIIIDDFPPLPPLPPNPTSPADIQLNSSVRHQTIQGWETTSQSGQDDNANFNSYKNQLFDKAVNELGLTRVRLEVRSGAEHTNDNYADFKSGKIDNTQWRNLRYAMVNDNNSATSINSSGFHFTELDSQIDKVIIPLRNAMSARGERLYINLNYVSFTSANLHSTNPSEYAEFMLVVFQHMQSKYGFVPDAIEIILEPDNTTSWRAPAIGQAIVAVGDRLASAGYRPDFIAPSTMSMANAVPWFDQIIQVPGVRNYLKEISYHRYTGVSDANLQAIASRAVQYGLRTSMLEHIGSGYDALHKDLKLGRNSAWQQFTLAFGTSDNGGQYYVVNPNGSISMGSRTRYLVQYFKYVRPGAVRIDATSSKSAFDPLAFVSPSGAYTVVVKATAGGSFTVGSLPAGTYGITYTTSSQTNANLPDVAVSAGQNLSTSIPAAGVITIYSKTGGVVLPPITPPLPPLPPIPPIVPEEPTTVPISTKFSVGTRVITNSSVNVRATPSMSGVSRGTQASASAGTVVGASVYADGYHWWNINYDSGVDGWSAENFIVKNEGTFTPPQLPPTNPVSTSDTTPPVVIITSPSSGVTVSGMVSIGVEASDPSGVDAVEIFVGNKRLVEDSSAPFEISWNTNEFTNGTHTVSARAFDKKYNNKTVNVNVTVKNGASEETRTETEQEKETSIPDNNTATTGTYGTKAVTWTNLVGASASGNNLQRTLTGESSNSGATSQEALLSGDGYVEFTVAEANQERAIGLSNGNSGTSLNDIDYAVFLTRWGTFRCQIYGASMPRLTGDGTYRTGDVFRISYEGGSIKCMQNGKVIVVWTPAGWEKPVRYPLIVDTALLSSGATLKNVTLTGNIGLLGSAQGAYTASALLSNNIPFVSSLLVLLIMLSFVWKNRKKVS